MTVAQLIILVYDLIGSLVVFTISYLSLKALKITQIKIFLFIFFGFSLMGTGLITHAIGSLTILISYPSRLIMDILYPWLNRVSLISEIASYLLIAIGYSLQFKGRILLISLIFPPLRRVKKAILPQFITEQLIGSLINAFLLIYITFHSFMVYKINRKKTSLFIFMGFLMILISQILAIFSLTIRFSSGILLSRSIYFLALISFLAMTAEVTRAK